MYIMALEWSSQAESMSDLTRAAQTQPTAHLFIVLLRKYSSYGSVLLLLQKSSCHSGHKNRIRGGSTANI